MSVTCRGCGVAFEQMPSRHPRVFLGSNAFRDNPGPEQDVSIVDTIHTAPVGQHMAPAEHFLESGYVTPETVHRASTRTGSLLWGRSARTSVPWIGPASPRKTAELHDETATARPGRQGQVHALPPVTPIHRLGTRVYGVDGPAARTSRRDTGGDDPVVRAGAGQPEQPPAEGHQDVGTRAVQPHHISAWRDSVEVGGVMDRLLADATMVAHFAYLVFAVLGGLLAWRWRKVEAHLFAAGWVVLVTSTPLHCPLTYAENRLRRRAG